MGVAPQLAPTFGYRSVPQLSPTTDAFPRPISLSSYPGPHAPCINIITVITYLYNYCNYIFSHRADHYNPHAPHGDDYWDKQHNYVMLVLSTAYRYHSNALDIQ